MLVAGEGDDRPGPAGTLIDQRGLTGMVRLLGVRTDIPDLLDAADLAVSSSRVEGSPLAILEQMQAARPIVATAVGGVPDLIDRRSPRPPRRRAKTSTASSRTIGGLLRDPDRAAALAGAPLTSAGGPPSSSSRGDGRQGRSALPRALRAGSAPSPEPSAGALETQGSITRSRCQLTPPARSPTLTPPSPLQ